MEKVIVTVELTENNYSAYIEKLPGCVTVGETFQVLTVNMQEAVEFHLEGLREDGEKVDPIFDRDFELVFRFDARSLLQHYSGIFTNSALEKLTGINQRQLQRYASGQTKPRTEQSTKIASALHNLGKELLVVEL